jgi:hypothetical protein
MLIEKKQPLPGVLKKELPVNFYLFVHSASIKHYKAKSVHNTFYNAKNYTLTLFYKPVSNVL